MQLTNLIFQSQKIKLSKIEQIIFEADLFTKICSELKEYFNNYRKHFEVIKFDLTDNERDEAMLSNEYIKWIIEDILFTGEYTLEGIAYYTHTPQDAIYDILIGNNKNPSAFLLERIILLHREVKAELYNAIRNKIAGQVLSDH